MNQTIEVPAPDPAQHPYRWAMLFGVWLIYSAFGLTISALAPMVGPMIGGLLNDSFGWRSIFMLQAGLGVAVGIVCLLFLPETNTQQRGLEAQPTLRYSFATLGRIPAFWAYALTCAFATAVFFSFLGGTPFVAVDMMGMTG